MSSFEMRKDLFADERDDNLNEIGKGTIRQDILGHVTGRSPYFDDHLFDGLLHLRCARSPHHHARIRSIDTSAAESMPGVRRIIRPEDVPHNVNTLLALIGLGRDDEALLQGKKVAYKGEAIVAVVAETERQARDAVAKVRIDYEVLPHVLRSIIMNSTIIKSCGLAILRARCLRPITSLKANIKCRRSNRRRPKHAGRLRLPR